METLAWDHTRHEQSFTVRSTLLDTLQRLDRFITLDLTMRSFSLLYEESSPDGASWVRRYAGTVVSQQRLQAETMGGRMRLGVMANNGDTLVRRVPYLYHFDVLLEQQAVGTSVTTLVNEYIDLDESVITDRHSLSFPSMLHGAKTAVPCAYGLLGERLATALR